MAKTATIPERTLEESTALRVLIKQLEEFRKIDPYINLSTVMCYLHVAADEGLSFKELERLVGDLRQSGISRNVALLSDGLGKDRERGFELVETETSDEERRRKTIKLTRKGVRVMDSLILLSRQLREEVRNDNKTARTKLAD